jgi:hypothetical protein
MTENRENVRVCKFPGCGTRLNAYNDSGYCGIHAYTGRTESKADKVADYACFYGYSDTQWARRFVEHARSKRGARPIEITCVSGNLFFHSKVGAMTGPVADIPEEILLPPGTTRINCEVVPESPVRGRMYQGTLNASLKHPSVVLQAENACSGVVIQITSL